MIGVTELNKRCKVKRVAVVFLRRKFVVATASIFAFKKSKSISLPATID